MLCSPSSQEGARHYTGTFSPQCVVSKLSDLTRHIVEMTDAHLQASDKHLKWELSQRDQTRCAAARKINPKSKQIFKILKIEFVRNHDKLMHHIYQKVLLQGTTSGLACGRGKLGSFPQQCPTLSWRLPPTALYIFSAIAYLVVFPRLHPKILMFKLVQRLTILDPHEERDVKMQTLYNLCAFFSFRILFPLNSDTLLLK